MFACFFSYGHSTIPTIVVKNTILSSLNCFYSFSNISWLYLCLFHYCIYLIPFIYVFIFFPLPHHLNYCNFRVSLDIRWYNTSNFIVFFSIVFKILGSLPLQINVRIQLPIPNKYLSGILIEITL